MMNFSKENSTFSTIQIDNRPFTKKQNSMTTKRNTMITMTIMMMKNQVMTKMMLIVQLFDTNI